MLRRPSTLPGDCVGAAWYAAVFMCSFEAGKFSCEAWGEENGICVGGLGRDWRSRWVWAKDLGGLFLIFNIQNGVLLFLGHSFFSFVEILSEFIFLP